MTDSHQQRPKSDFLAAEDIKGILHGREKSEQERIIRWVTESLGIASASARTTSPIPPQSVPSPAQSPEQGVHVGGRPLDIKAFVEQKKPKSDIQFAAVVAYFHRFEVFGADRKETITPDDLKEAARLVGGSRFKFKAPSVPLNNAVKQGYLDRADRGAFKVNTVGENLVAMTLPGAAGDGNGPRPRKKRAAPKQGSKKAAKRQTKKQAKKAKAS
jgi:hypothetical protein